MEQEALKNQTHCLNQPNYIAMECHLCKLEPRCEFFGKGDYTIFKHIHSTKRKRGD